MATMDQNLDTPVILTFTLKNCVYSCVFVYKYLLGLATIQCTRAHPCFGARFTLIRRPCAITLVGALKMLPV